VSLWLGGFVLSAQELTTIDLRLDRTCIRLCFFCDVVICVAETMLSRAFIGDLLLVVLADSFTITVELFKVRSATIWGIVLSMLPPPNSFDNPDDWSESCTSNWLWIWALFKSMSFRVLVARESLSLYFTTTFCAFTDEGVTIVRDELEFVGLRAELDAPLFNLSRLLWLGA